MKEGILHCQKLKRIKQKRQGYVLYFRKWLLPLNIVNYCYIKLHEYMPQTLCWTKESWRNHLFSVVPLKNILTNKTDFYKRNKNNAWLWEKGFILFAIVKTSGIIAVVHLLASIIHIFYKHSKLTNQWLL